MPRRFRPIPPVRSCRGCGGDLRSWTEAPLCPRCADSEVGADPGWTRTARLGHDGGIEDEDDYPAYLLPSDKPAGGDLV